MRAGNPNFVYGCISAFVLLENVLGGKGKYITLQAVAKNTYISQGLCLKFSHQLQKFSE